MTTVLPVAISLGNRAERYRQMITRKNTYRYLRSILAKYAMTQKDLCIPTELSESAINQRFAGKQPWTLTQMYSVMDFLQIPYDQLHICFPADITEEVAA